MNIDAIVGRIARDYQYPPDQVRKSILTDLFPRSRSERTEHRLLINFKKLIRNYVLPELGNEYFLEQENGPTFTIYLSKTLQDKCQRVSRGIEICDIESHHLRSRLFFLARELTPPYLDYKPNMDRGPDPVRFFRSVGTVEEMLQKIAQTYQGIETYLSSGNVKTQ